VTFKIAIVFQIYQRIKQNGTTLIQLVMMPKTIRSAAQGKALKPSTNEGKAVN
jgi:hypothetical protein